MVHMHIWSTIHGVRAKESLHPSQVPIRTPQWTLACVRMHTGTWKGCLLQRLWKGATEVAAARLVVCGHRGFWNATVSRRRLPLSKTPFSAPRGKPKTLLTESQQQSDSVNPILQFVCNPAILKIGFTLCLTCAHSFAKFPVLISILGTPILRFPILRIQHRFPYTQSDSVHRRLRVPVRSFESPDIYSHDPRQR